MFLFKRSNGYYYLYFTDNLTQKRRSVSTKAKTKSQALDFLNNFKNDSSGNTVKPAVIYLETLSNEALRYAKNNLSSGSVTIYEATLRNLSAILGNKPISVITNKDIELYKETRIKTVEKTTCNIEIRTLKAIFNLAVKWNWLLKSPLKDIKEFSTPEKEHIAFSDLQINLILNTIDNPDIKNIVLFALYTGCRINEILNVQLKDINLNERVITIRNKFAEGEEFKTKSGKVRYIPVSDKLFNLLKSLCFKETLCQKENIITLFNPESYLFNNNGYRYNKNFISKKFKSYLRLAGLPEKFHLHCLRHTFISNLIRAGANVNYVKQIAGHSDIKTTERYIHIGIEDLREAVNKV